MIRADLVIVDAAQLLTLRGPAPRVRGALKDLSIIEGGCLAARGGRIVFVGTRDQFLKFPPRHCKQETGIPLQMLNDLEPRNCHSDNELAFRRCPTRNDDRGLQ